jgi:hypothetical protein
VYLDRDNATDSLGRQIAWDLATREATILPHGHSREKGEATGFANEP